MRFSILAVGSLVLMTSLPANAVILYATTDFRNLISFDSAAPGTLLSSAPITGLVDTSEAVVGIDFRPADGRLYAWGNAPGSIYRLYTLNLTTGLATRVPGNVDLNRTGTNWGFDFNPQVDRIRIVSDANVSLRLDPNTGALAADDTALNPSSSVNGVAYDRNDLNPATPTTLFGIDSASDQLVRIGGVDGTPSPNAGAVTNIGALGFNVIGSNGFDIGLNGIGYAALSISAPTPSNLYTINLTTGGATLLGLIGNGQDGVRSLSALVPEPSNTLLALFAGLVLRLRRRRC